MPANINAGGFAIALVLAAAVLSVHASEVAMLDDIQEALPTPAARVAMAKEAIFAGSADNDAVGLDNGDDTDLLEEQEGGGPLIAPKKGGSKATAGGEGKAVSPGAKAAPGGASDGEVQIAPGMPKKGPSMPATGKGPAGAAPQSEAPPVSATPAAPVTPPTKVKLPKMPKVSKTDMKYMPAIMNKLMKMRSQVAKIKGANWMQILEAHRDAVVQLMVVKKKFMWKAAYRAPLSEEISGSGWFINNEEFGVDTNGDMVVVTNAHVAKNAGEINILIPSLGQEPIPTEVVGVCSQRDIALVKVKDKKKLLALYKAKTGREDIIRLSLGDSDAMKRGARCMAVGYPLGLKSVKASMGIVSGYQQFKSALYLQITAPINPGNSGGPLLNDDGKVVGINSAKIASASGMSFSISSVQLKVMLDVLYQRRQFIVPFLGYSFSTGTRLIQEYLKVKGDSDKTGGIYVTKIHPNGLFKMAGAKKGDLLLTVDGASIDRFGQTWMPTMKDNINILGLLARKKIGTPMVLGVWRKSEGKMLSLHAKYDSTPEFKVPMIYEPVLQKPKYQTFAGIVFMELSVNLVTVMLQSNVAELIQYMKPENRMKPAVIIAGVLPGSIAGLDGSIRPGLILKKINGQPVTAMSDVCKILSKKAAKWYTVSTSQTFTALKAKSVAAFEAEAGKAHANVGQFCSPKKKAGKRKGKKASGSAAGMKPGMKPALLQYLSRGY